MGSINMIPENMALSNEPVSYLSLTLHLPGGTSVVGQIGEITFIFRPVVCISAHTIKHVSDQTNPALPLNYN